MCAIKFSVVIHWNIYNVYYVIKMTLYEYQTSIKSMHSN